MPVDVGSEAPDFTLKDDDRQAVALHARRGRVVVLAFFPAAFSSVCTRELCTLSGAFGRLDQLSRTIDVFGISVDTFFALKAFRQLEQIGFPLLSDFNKEVIRDYDVFNADMVGLRGVAKRALFLIDGDGIVRYKEVLDDARLEPDYPRLYDALSALGCRLPG
jgi:peroxiredoxin